MSRKIYLAILCILFMPVCTYALCSDSEVARLKKFVANINTAYTETETDNDFYYTIYINNVTPELKIRDNRRNIYTDSSITLSNYSPGQTIKFEVLANTSTCDKKVGMLYVTLPPYNKYYKNDLCKGYEEYYLCQKYRSVDIDEETFRYRINKYHYSNYDEVIDIEEDESFFDKIYNFVTKYYYYLLIGFVLLLIVLEITYYKREKAKYRI